MQQEVFEVLAEARNLEDLRKIEPKAREVYRRYRVGWTVPMSRSWQIHRRISS